MTISPTAAGIKTFSAWADAVRSSAQVPSETDVEQAAVRFKVPLEAARGVRAEMLEANAKTVDDVGVRTKGLRQESQGGLPAGTPSAKGIGAAASLVMQKPAGDKPMMRLPAHVDVRSAFMASAVPLSSSDPALSHIEHVSIRDGKDHHFDVFVGVPKDRTASPSVTLQFYGPDGSPGQRSDLNPFLARSMLPLLDVVTSKPLHAGDGPGMQSGAAAMRAVLDHAELTSQAASRDDREAAHAVIDDAAKAFDAGKHDVALQGLGQVVKNSPFGDARARAGFTLGEMLTRLGRHDEGIAHVVVAFPRLSPFGQVVAQEFLARALNSQRDFPRAETFAQGALREGLALRQAGETVELGSAYFALAFAQKNQGRMDEAITSMTASLAERPDSTATSLALAGYLAIAGRKDEAKALFAKIPVPPRTELGYLDYHTNAAWFAGVSRDKDAVLSSVATALETARRFHQPGTLQYLKAEPDLDWLRGDKDFQAVLAGQPAPVPTTSVPSTPTPSSVPAQATPSAASATPAPDPLAAMASHVSPATALGQLPAQALVSLVNERIEKALEGGQRTANFPPRDLDKLLTAWSSPHDGYRPFADTLEKLGYRTQVDGFVGVSVILEKRAAPDTMEPAAFARDLAQKLPGPPSGAGASAGERLGQLVADKLKEAALLGKTSVRLETGDLDRLLGRDGPSYGDVASSLVALGYKASSDGFIGVSFHWKDKATAAPGPVDLVEALTSGVKKPGPASSGADAVVSLIEQKIAEAGKAGKTKIHCTTSELDRLLDSTFGSAGGGYRVLSEALKAKGFTSSFDGFMGVSASWT